jgi:hypothetical protein
VNAAAHARSASRLNRKIFLLRPQKLLLLWCYVPIPESFTEAPTNPDRNQKIGFLGSFFVRTPTLGQVQISHAAASVLRVREKLNDTHIDQPTKKHGGDCNQLDQTGARKLKLLLSKGHSIEVCKV